MITKSLRLQFIICSFIFFILPNRFLSESQDIENKNLQACEITPDAISVVNYMVDHR